jgi:sugar lactone lactonase YvrE
MVLQQLTVEPVALGEGPCWHANDGVLYWIDILGKSLHCFDPSTGDDRSWSFDEMLGTVAPRAAGGLLLAFEGGFAVFDPATGKLEPWESIESSRETRFNDGKCDPAGRFWCGSMDLKEERPLGTLYRTGSDRVARPVVRPVTISNGMGWSLDRKTMYYVDSPTRQVSAFDYDHDAGEISHRRVAIQLTEQDGWPDGMTTDGEGKIWLAEWGAGRIGRWDPETGERLESQDVPAPHTSACCFGGPDLRDLYITTARKGLTAEQLEQYPLSGCLFRVRTGVTGSPTFAFDG